MSLFQSLFKLLIISKRSKFLIINRKSSKSLLNSRTVRTLYKLLKWSFNLKLFIFINKSILGKFFSIDTNWWHYLLTRLRCFFDPLILLNISSIIKSLWFLNNTSWWFPQKFYFLRIVILRPRRRVSIHHITSLSSRKDYSWILLQHIQHVHIIFLKRSLRRKMKVSSFIHSRRLWHTFVTQTYEYLGAALFSKLKKELVS